METCATGVKPAWSTSVESCIGKDTTILALRRRCASPAILSAGISCQHYSQPLGDKCGAADPGSLSLPWTLRADMLLGSSAIVLECVAQAGDDPCVQACLQTYGKAMAYCASEVILDLCQVWTR